MKIIIECGGVRTDAELNDSPTARAIGQALPITGTASTWGDEIWFGIPVKMEQSPDARADVEVGELGYWPVGCAFCIFFGPTPASTGNKPRAASPVNIIGRVSGDPLALKSVSDGEPVLIRAEEDRA